MGGLNVTHVRRERIPVLWSTVRENALVKGFRVNKRDTKYPCVCRGTKLPRRDVRSEKARHIGRR